MGALLTGVAAVVVIAGLAIGGQALNLWSFGYFGPKYEQVRTDIYKNSQMYNDGMLTDLYNLQHEYDKADPEGKLALKGLILHNFASYPHDRLPADLQQFYADLQSN